MKKNTAHCDLQSCYLCRFCLTEWKAAVNQAKVTERYKKGSLIIREGDPVQRLFFLNEGIVKVHKKWETDKELIIRFAKKGDVIGHRGLGKFNNYPVSATALENITVCSVDLDFFKSTLRVNNEFAIEMLMFFADELQESEQKMSQLAHMQVKGRVANCLLALRNKFGVDQEGYISFVISWQDLASYAGTIYETVYKFINELKEEQAILVSEKRIKIINDQILTQLIK